MSEHWDDTTDVLVVGSGAGAMTAACRAHDQGADVLVVEKTDQYGGTSATSGGVVWLPATPTIAEAGGEDSRESALSYLRSVVDDPELDDHLRTYVEKTTELITYLHLHTRVRLRPLPQYPDMYPERPDSMGGYRAHEPQPLDGKLLGDDLYRMRSQHIQTKLFGLISWTVDESTVLLTRDKGWLPVALRIVMRYLLDLPGRMKSTRDRYLTIGNGLMGSLRLTLRDKNVPLWLDAPMAELIREDGRVVGAVIERGGQRLRVRADRGVILGAGGFEHNESMRKQYLPNPTESAWSAGSPGNTGDAIRAAQALGAATRMMDEAWWGPILKLPGEESARMMFAEKNLPGGILVSRAGKRFVNESSSYTRVTKRIIEGHREGLESIPCFLIFDSQYRKRYQCGPMLPGSFQPDWALPDAVKQWMAKADSVAELATSIGVDAGRLETTLAEFNREAAQGKDPVFERGEALYDKLYGDYTHQPNPCLEPISQPPFYAVKVYPGDLGTKGGLRSDTRARVLDDSGEPIPGLYAIGNSARSLMGSTYPASGAPLGAGMIFGMIAADHCCAD